MESHCFLHLCPNYKSLWATFVLATTLIELHLEDFEGEITFDSGLPTTFAKTPFKCGILQNQRPLFGLTPWKKRGESLGVPSVDDFARSDSQTISFRKIHFTPNAFRCGLGVGKILHVLGGLHGF